MTANVETMAYRFGNRADTPWHGLGVPVDRNEQVSTDEFRIRAGADWEAVKRPLWVRATATTPFKEHIETDQFALMRSDNHFMLNYVSKQYQPVQNESVFNFFHDFCREGDMDLETGGVLDSGRTVWCLASIREGFTLAGGDNIQGYLLFSNSHGGSAGRIKFTPIRVVCANTLALAHNGSGSEFRIHHKSKFVSNVAKDALGLGHKSLTDFKERAEFLATQRMDDIAYSRFIDKLFPATDKGDGEIVRPRNYDKAVDALWKQTGANLSRGTWWQGYNAITYMIDHMHNRKDSAAALNNNWFGTGHKLKQQALEVALEMAK
ncbi:LGT_TIGR03299, phage/plasmid-like protein TIGR03299 [uncultured Caudovirales phage]|uniref:LGT_TIGR03299, phage/plasmid-like protein TIGR03299 n=1 Tax=uncultured Caudovirales phage TaxID=2100421 RepID=A0A6J5RZQ5_9CAUD|nr:LGT_TIGR03299, phage/plasmid-like protein TIGR03299 [uncultured Caudovirales phage]